MSNRRNFIKASLAGIALLTIPKTVNADWKQALPTTKPAKREDKFKVGIAGNSFKNFSLDETLNTMEYLDVRYLCIKGFHLPFTCTEEEAKAFHAKCASKGVTGYAVGPIYMTSREDIDKYFDYAKRVGVKMIVGVPNHDLLPYVEKMVKQYDMIYAIHNHGPDKVELYPDAADVWSHIENLDNRIGLCFDIGHNLRFGKDPIKDLEKYHTRIYDIHIKDVTGVDGKAPRPEIGRGVIDYPNFIRALRKVGYSGVCSLEHEKKMDNPFLGIAESIGYFRAVMDTVDR